MSRLTNAVAAAVLAALVLTGCAPAQTDEADTGTSATEGTGAESTAGTDAESGDETDAEPAAGDVIDGDGYSLTVPEGWMQVAQAPTGADVAAMDSNDADGFADNLNVVISPAGLVSLDVVEQAGPAEIEAAGGTDVVVGERITAAGNEIAHVTANATAQGVDYVVEQYALSSTDQTYLVTFSFSPEVPQSDRVALAESVLATWAWS